MVQAGKRSSDDSALVSGGVDNPNRPFGFISLVALVVASMIGSGVFTTSGFAIGDLKDARLVVAVWCIGGVVALCGAIGYGALAARLPGSGGEYLYLSRAIHPAIGFLAGWISLVAGFTVPMAVAAKTFATYLLSGWAGGEQNIVWVAAAAIIVAAVANMISASAGAWLQNSMVLVKLLLLASFIAIAWAAPADKWYANEIISSQEVQPTTQYLQSIGITILAMASSLVWVSLSYTGFNAAIYVAGEAKRAERWVPRSMLVATIIVTILYVVLNYIFVHGAPAEKIAFVPEVALVVAKELSGDGLASLVRMIVCMATFTSVWSIAMAGPRVYTQMTSDGVMPNWLVGQGREPRLAILVQAILAIVVLYFASLQQMLGYLGLTLSLCAAVTVACVWMPAKSGEALISVWAKIAATLYVVASLSLIVLASFTRVYEAIAAGVTITLGIVLLVLWSLVRGK
jgi:APA family basic amino acid/polyamine antiporter